MPLVVGKQTQGYISLQNVDREHAFDEADVRLLTTLANSMSVALESARRFEQIQQRNAELAVINAVQEGLVAQLDMEAIYELVVNTIAKTVGADTVYIAHYDAQNEMIEFSYGVEQGIRISGPPIPLGAGLTSLVINSNATHRFGTKEAMESSEQGLIPITSPGADRDLNESWLGVPLRQGDTVTGVVAVQSHQTHRFDENAERLLSTIAASMGLALESARRFEEIQQRSAELATVNHISRAIGTELDFDALLKLVGEQIREAFGAEIIYVALLNREAGIIEFPYNEGETFETLQYGEGLTSHIIQTGEPLLLNRDIDKQHTMMGIPQVGVESASYLGVPIKIGGEAIGVVSVQSVAQEGRFDEDDQRLLGTIAANIGAAIRNARLYHEIELRAGQMAALAEVGQDISATLELDTVMARMATHAQKHLAAATSAVFQVQPNGRTIRPITAAGSIAGPLMDIEIKIGEGIVGSVIQNGTAERVADTGTDDRSFHVKGTDETRAGERLMVAPLMQHDQAIGAMSVWRDPGEPNFSEGDLSFLDGLARQAVIAMQNARLYEEAEEARADAVQANEAKSTFLANMSHELRTPLNAIIGFTRIVRRKGKDALPQKQLDNLDKVTASADHLLGLINTILDIAKIEAGRMDVQTSTVAVQSLVDSCLATTEAMLNIGVKLTADVPGDFPAMTIDQAKVRQILLNLLSNAAKFTEQGAITLTARLDENQVTLAVTDTGIGIPANKLDKVFEEFQQADSSTTRQYGGTGLGLAISRSMAGLLGGSLTAISAEGEGSTFTLTLPLHYGEPIPLPPPTERQSPRPADDERPLILAIDDDPDAIYLLQENLSEAGYQVVGVTSGDEGLSLARTLKPFAITLDVMMPHKDGWQVLHELKDNDATRDIPVIMLTIVDNRALGYRLGAAGYLLKPFTEGALADALDRLRAANGGVKPQRILVADDDPNVPDMIRQLLENTDYTIEVAADGAEALAMIERNPPDALLLDLMMPNVDGFTVIERLREADNHRDIPIMVLTAKSLTAAERSALEKSVSVVIEKKGLEAEQLLQKLTAAIKP